MGYVLTLVALLILGGVLFVGGMVAHSENPTTSIGKFVAWGGLALVVILGAVATFHASTKTIEPGHIGIVKQFGSYKGTLSNGFKTKSPFASVNVVSVKDELRTYQMDDQVGDAGSAVSSDSQPVYLVVQVRYQLEQAKAVQLYNQTGGAYVERILDPAVFQYTKEITAKYKAIEFAQNREQIRQQIETQLNAAIEPSGLLIKGVTLKDVDFTEDLSKAIEQTVEAEQQAKREQAKVQISTAQANQKIATAKGEAQSNIIAAQGEATANKLRQRSLTPLLLQQLAIEKLNPSVTTIYCGEQKICIPNGTSVVPVTTP